MLCGCCGGAGAGGGGGGVRLLLPCSLVAIVDAMTRDGCMHQCGGGNSGPEKREKGGGGRMVMSTARSISIYKAGRITHFSTGAAARCVV